MSSSSSTDSEIRWSGFYLISFKLVDGEVSTRRVTCFAFRYFTVNNNINVVGVLSLAELLDNWQKNLLLRKSPLRLRLIGNVESKFVLHKIKLAFEIKRKAMKTQT